MRYARYMRIPFAGMSALIAAMLTLTGCPVTEPVDPTEDPEYQTGFDDGFKQDDWYWGGYADSYDTMAALPIYYEGSDIPYLETPLYDAGYWDGVWWAYNDGYFVCYRYAFIVGFSEGYDNAYWPDYLDFLASDVHTELFNGGWADGYNDGFSEGRVFGAYDYEADLPFDWEYALADYENLTDLYFEEVDVGTGEYGPVTLYEYGVDPAGMKSARPERGILSVEARQLRGNAATKSGRKADDSIYRTLTTETQTQLSVKPTASTRNSRTLRLTTTWLERVSSYTGSTKSGPVSPRAAR